MQTGTTRGPTRPSPTSSSVWKTRTCRDRRSVCFDIFKDVLNSKDGAKNVCAKAVMRSIEVLATIGRKRFPTGMPHGIPGSTLYSTVPRYRV
jgi:hypothetical protein